MLRRSLIIVLVLSALGMAVPCRGQDTRQQETNRLAALLHWRPGDAIAEIGAGKGDLALLAAQHVGSSGRVYTTELDPAALTHLKDLAAKEKNITAIRASEADTGLPAGCCDSIYMRLVYHHLIKPVDIDASLFRSLKPGGLLAVIDEDPYPGSQIPDGVPKNRGGHGVPQKILVDELTSVGFKVETVLNDWPGRDSYHLIYCVVFRKMKPD